MSGRPTDEDTDESGGLFDDDRNGGGGSTAVESDNWYQPAGSVIGKAPTRPAGPPSAPAKAASLGSAIGARSPAPTEGTSPSPVAVRSPEPASPGNSGLMLGLIGLGTFGAGLIAWALIRPRWPPAK